MKRSVGSTGPSVQRSGMQLLETLPNGREIFSRPKDNIKLEKEQAIKLHNAWKQSGREFKPIFQDNNGQLWEIEGGGNTFKTAKNPEGYRFGNWLKHFKRGITRRGIEKQATPNLKEVTAAVKSRFPGLSNADYVKFAKGLINLNEQQMVKTLASRQVGQHTDHMIPLAKGGLNWFKNFANIDAPTNLRKSAKLLSKRDQQRLNISRNRQQMILSALSSDIVKDNPKNNFQENVIKNAFKPNSNTSKTLKGYTKSTITKGLNIPAQADVIQTDVKFDKKPTVLQIMKEIGTPHDNVFYSPFGPPISKV